MKILYVGDIVGSPGRRAFTKIAARFRAEGADLVVANGENAAGGRGPTPDIAESLFEAGADVVTLGDHTWDQREIMPYLDTEPRIIRPANFSPRSHGRGMTTVETRQGPVSVAIFIGRVFMPPHADCPFRAADEVLKNKEALGKIILAEIHAEATSEKIAFGRYLDGRVSAIVGTHSHVQTSDERILPNGSAYITDLGMTGPKDSVLGREVEPVIQRFITGMPHRFGVASEDVALEGVLLEIDEHTGRAVSITRLREPFG